MKEEIKLTEPNLWWVEEGGERRDEVAWVKLAHVNIVNTDS